MGHGFLSLTNPDTGTILALVYIIVKYLKIEEYLLELLLVWLVCSIWVTNWGHEVILVLEDVVTDTSEISELHIGIKVDLDNTVGDGIQELLLGRSGSTVEDQEDWLVVLGSNSLLDMGLVLAEELWAELDVTWLVDTVNVTETSGNREVWGDWGKSLVDSKDILWLSVKGVVVNILVVDTVLLTTGDTNLL